MSRIYLIRHGEVAWNRENSYIGATDLPLNDEGKSQAALLADRLAQHKIAAVYSSDLTRARQTAEIIAERLGLPAVAIPELREVNYGEWEGVSETKLPTSHPDIYDEWRLNPAEVRIPGGETFAELKERAFSAFCRIAESHPSEDVVIVGHKSVNRVILCCLMGIDINRYKQIAQGNAALNVIERRADGRFVVESVNDAVHLL
ncbi:MAG: histidine phosphatase family protein [Armatimonadetes bacterium]|nr:histidine phosphatase family protein [Armatimonadota bacterium]